MQLTYRAAAVLILIQDNRKGKTAGPGALGGDESLLEEI